MNTFPPREIVERLRLQYPAGCRWDNGSGLGAAYGADVIRRI